MRVVEVRKIRWLLSQTKHASVIVVSRQTRDDLGPQTSSTSSIGEAECYCIKSIGSSLIVAKVVLKSQRVIAQTLPRFGLFRIEEATSRFIAI